MVILKLHIHYVFIYNIPLAAHIFTYVKKSVVSKLQTNT